MKNYTSEFMVSNCHDCGKVIESNGHSVEIWWKKWVNNLTPTPNVKIVYENCFKNYRQVGIVLPFKI